MQQYTLDFLKLAYKSSFGGKSEIIAGNLCGCFDCKSTFRPSEIKDWIKEHDSKETAVCPKCNNDTVVSSKWPVNDPSFLNEMHSYYCNGE